MKNSKELILVLDFGGRYKELIARTVRELDVYSEIRRSDMSLDEIVSLAPIGIILTGEADSLSLENPYECGQSISNSQVEAISKLGISTSQVEAISKLGIPILSFCCHLPSIRDFVLNTCKAKGEYMLDDYIEKQVQDIRQKVGKERVLLALSGGVDSSVCAAILARAVPSQLTCVFVDHGFMRKDEGDQIEQVFSKHDLHFIRVNAQKRFLARLGGIRDPEEKRKRIGEEFIRVFEEESKKLNIPYLAQGTIYPDIVESGGKHGATIKSHHNVGGLPEKMDFKGIIEPLSGLFKDEVRKLGAKLGLPSFLTDRQPFPGPGLAIRIMGEVSNEKLEVLKEVDAIVREELDGLNKNRPSQYFAVMTDTKTVGVKGEARTYNYAIVVRAVTTDDFMTCEYTKLSHEVLSKISTRITSEVPSVSRVVYDITAKPPATVEWE